MARLRGKTPEAFLKRHGLPGSGKQPRPDTFLRVWHIVRQLQTGATGQQMLTRVTGRSGAGDSQKKQNRNVQYRQKRQSNPSTAFFGGIKAPVMVKMSANNVNSCAEKGSCQRYLLFWGGGPHRAGQWRLQNKNLIRAKKYPRLPHGRAHPPTSETPRRTVSESRPPVNNQNHLP